MKEDIVEFKTNARISNDLLKNLMEKGKKLGLAAIFPFEVKDIKIADWVNLKCRYGCNRFNTNWCCPPASPSSDKVRTVLKEYSRALLLVGNKHHADFYGNHCRKRMEHVRCWKGTVSMERELFLEGYYKAFALVGESCALCETCAYPEPCRFPQEKRPSVESFSIDVIGTLKRLGTAPVIAENRTQYFKYYSIILLD